MKLSEAIRMNGMMKPQGFGIRALYSKEAPCAIGGALQVVGATQTHETLAKIWPWVSRNTRCPGCDSTGDSSLRCEALRRREFDLTLNILWHLNDQHKWTRQQIADWVETVEPAESAQEQACELVCTETTV
jgi:hypothetical protein